MGRGWTMNQLILGVAVVFSGVEVVVCPWSLAMASEANSRVCDELHEPQQQPSTVGPAQSWTAVSGTAGPVANLVRSGALTIGVS